LSSSGINLFFMLRLSFVMSCKRVSEKGQAALR